jgi:lauroyl/myristoyl acyltransferase
VTSLAGRGVNALKKLTPAALMPVNVRLRTQLARRRPDQWSEAQREMRFVVGDDQPDEVIDRLAAAYLQRMIWRGEARWHPRLVTRQPITGLERLTALQDAGRPFIVSFTHHGDYEGISPSLAWAGIRTHAIATSAMFSKDQPAWLRQQARVVTYNEGVTLLDVARGSARIKDLLSQGHPVAIASDIMGGTPVRWLGHDVRFASGAARIAFECQVPVAVVTSRPNPARPDRCGALTVADLLQPGDFAGVGDLLDAMLAQHETAVRAWPEAAEYPLRRATDPSVR